MSLLEEVSERSYNSYFVDLFVRVSNALAITMYKRFGYAVYRRVLGYYSGEEDAFGACRVTCWRALGLMSACRLRICVCLSVCLSVCLCSCGVWFSSTSKIRYAESPATRPRQEVGDTHDAADNARRAGMVVGRRGRCKKKEKARVLLPGRLSFYTIHFLLLLFAFVLRSLLTSCQSS